MKKIFLAITCVFSFVANACADNYQPINLNQLPEKAQTFLSTHFPEAKVSLVQKEIELVKTNYDVIFEDSSKVEFDHKGNWTEVDCFTHPVPVGIVPEAINKVIKAHYPNTQVTKIERDYREVEVKLTNRTELTFNKHLQLVDID